MILNFLSSSLLLVALVASTSGLCKPPGEKDVTVTLFQWSFDAVAKECTDFLGPKGYGLVEISPPQEHIVGKSWWTSYQPVSYKIAGRLGDRAAFINMIETCHAAGVKVIVDAVINHMTAQSTGVGTGGTTFTKYEYPDLYEDRDFHTERRSIGNNYRDRHNVQFCQLLGLADLDTASEKVRTTIANYLNDLISLGADGFRIDAAKHIPADDLSAIKAKLSNPEIFWVSEVIYGHKEAVQPEEYLGVGDVDEFRFGRALKDAFLKKSLSVLQTIGIKNGMLPSHKARTFVDNWDTERNNTTLTYKDGALYALANAFMLAWPYGSPNVYSGYSFSCQDDSPPQDGLLGDTTSSGNWLFQHRWRATANMVAFRKAAADNPVTKWSSKNGGKTISFGRGDKAFIVINNDEKPIKATIKTSLPPGTYCDIFHGDITESGCDGESFAVSEDGRMKTTINAHDARAFYR